MKRPFVFALLVLAAIIAVEPLLHEHPLQQSHEAVVCAACAAGTGQVAVAPPVVAAPLAVTYRLIAITFTCPSFDAPLSLPSRAPPAL